MRVLISGASGLVGQGLIRHLSEEGFEICRLVRGRPTDTGDIQWDPVNGTLDPASLAGCQAVVNLSGESVAAGAWSDERKRRIRDSRIQCTRTLCNAFAAMGHPPEVMVSASAIGYYGDRGNVMLEESAEAGTGFLAEVCQEWEAEAERATSAGVRVVRLRIGVVLSTRGGALAKMTLPFRLGLGGVLGDGAQYMSWIALPDLIRAIRWCISRKDIRGAVNAVSPHAVTNRQFTSALGRALHRPAVLPVPAFLLRAVMGEMADEMLLASTRVHPGVLSHGEFDYLYPKVEEGLRRLLTRSE